MNFSVTPLELHLLYSDLPPFFDDDGVPLALLRLDTLMRPWSTSPVKDWRKFVTQQLFADRRMTYENFKGMNRYTSWQTDWFDISPAEGPLLNCWIELWLSDMNGLTQRKDTYTQYTVNCYDLAAISQALFALGTDISKCRVKYIDPFRYLKATNLIGGINHCNNPYFGRQGTFPGQYCPPTEQTRSFIGNHMFLTSENTSTGLVYDVCVGPQLGTLRLEAYPKEATDQEFSQHTKRHNMMCRCL